MFALVAVFMVVVAVKFRNNFIDFLTHKYIITHFVLL